MAELRWAHAFPATEDVGVRFKKRHDLVAGRSACACSGAFLGIIILLVIIDDEAIVSRSMKPMFA